MLLDELRVRWGEALSERPPCVACGSAHVWRDGVCLRKASLWDGAQTEFAADVPQRRLRCARCRNQWVRRAEGITSRAHYQPCVVSHAIAAMHAESSTALAEIARAHRCHRRTLSRWTARVAALAEPAALTAAIVAEAEAPVVPALPIATRPARAQSRVLLLRALIVLALLEVLASLRGLEPPALAHAAALVPRVPAFAHGPRIRGDPRSAR